jgi:hypothetical protein
VIPSEHFNTVLYTGNAPTGQSITGVGFQPDFIWIKEKSSTSWHLLVDAIRGEDMLLASNSINAEEDFSGLDRYVYDIGADGFKVGTNNRTNENSQTYVSWNWKAGGTGTSVAESGTGNNCINAHTHSANTDAGFSIVKYAGRGDEISASYHTKVGHGLNSRPEFVIIKSLDTARGWAVMADAITGTVKWQDNHLRLDTTAAKSGALYVSDTASDSTHFYVGDDALVNAANENYIAYCFHSVDGYSKVGSYTGNGSADGPYVHTGFRPAYVMVKRTDSIGSWCIVDTERPGYNGTPNSTGNARLRADTTGVEDDKGRVDILSNGFKPRVTYAETNASGATYIFIAFAEQPFKYSNAR